VRKLLPPFSLASESHAHAVLVMAKVERGLRRRNLTVNLPKLFFIFDSDILSSAYLQR
jgi:hypothetical protein